MAEGEFEDLGANSGLVEDLYARYVEDPASVPEGWREFFDERGAPEQAPSAPSPPAPSPSAAPPQSPSAASP